MGWDSKVSYRPGATINVSVKATSYQRADWTEAARRHGKASPGAFLAWAGDVYIAMQRAYFDAAQEHDDALHPLGPVEEAKRREELPQGRILATFRTAAHCKSLASELGRTWVRWGGQDPAEDPAPLLQRFQREDM